MDDDWLTRMIDDARARERAEAEAHDAKGGNGAADGYSARFEEEEEEDDDDAFEYEPNAYAGGDLTESEEGDMLGTSPPCAGSTGGVGEEDGGVFADACGSPAVVLVGFRAEEWPRVRTLVDELGGYDVPVIPARSEHAWMTLEEVTREREPDWESPRTSNASAARGGEYGSQRMVAFSGLDLGEVAVVVSAIESQGLPRLPVIIASEENLQKPLGESLALAIRAHRRDARRRRRRGSTAHDDDDDKNEVKDDTTSREAETVVVPEVLTTTPSALDARAESERRAAAARASAVAAVSEPSHARDETGDNNERRRRRYRRHKNHKRNVVVVVVVVETSPILNGLRDQIPTPRARPSPRSRLRRPHRRRSRQGCRPTRVSERVAANLSRSFPRHPSIHPSSLL